MQQHDSTGDLCKAEEKSRHFSCIIDENESLLVCFCDKATELKEMDTWKYSNGRVRVSLGQKKRKKEWDEGLKDDAGEVLRGLLSTPLHIQTEGEIKRRALIPQP